MRVGTMQVHAQANSKRPKTTTVERSSNSNLQRGACSFRLPLNCRSPSSGECRCQMSTGETKTITLMMKVTEAFCPTVTKAYRYTTPIGNAFVLMTTTKIARIPCSIRIFHWFGTLYALDCQVSSLMDIKLCPKQYR
ncbi:hypothetical protein KP509_01G117200 [Ceratopteris richardii]|uniref:Uncharacterized protein n=1 Tax=Ceratopteris richardii TaxID=49495 RepID=A0A8T2VGR9_CERRI|nr:hypothetical protein KP509_01G117200 [Ceratopteris richardii]